MPCETSQKLEIAHLRRVWAAENEKICQTLGQVLGYPWYKDDQKNFPGATKEDGVCVGPHVAETLAEEAADKILTLENKNEKMLKILQSIYLYRLRYGKNFPPDFVFFIEDRVRPFAKEKQ